MDLRDASKQRRSSEKLPSDREAQSQSRWMPALECRVHSRSAAMSVKIRSRRWDLREERDSTNRAIRSLKKGFSRQEERKKPSVKNERAWLRHDASALLLPVDLEVHYRLRSCLCRDLSAHPVEQSNIRNRPSL